MKKLLSVLLVITISVCSLSIGYGEDILNSIGSFFSNTANEVANWATGVWESASEWIGNAWGDASEWVSKAWNDSSSWASEIWGDASTWISDTYDSASGAVSNWWVNTFDAVTVNSKKAWSWIKDTSASVSEKTKEKLNKVKEVITKESSESELRSVFDDLGDQLGLVKEDTEKVWDSLVAYAKEKGISTEAAVKLALPYLVKLNSDKEEAQNSGIPGIAVAQYLTAIMEKNGVTNDSADAFLSELGSALNEIK